MIPRARPDRWRQTLRRGLLVLLAVLASSAVAAPPFFNGQLPRPEAQSLVQPSQPQAGVSREQAAGMVQRQTGGRVLSTTPVQRGGGAVGYEVRVLVDGKRVKNVFVDERGNIRAQD